MISRRPALHVAALLGPIVLVQGFRVFTGSTPAAAAAAGDSADAVQVALAPAPGASATAEQLAAIKWLGSQPSQAASSPMNHEAPRPLPVEPVQIVRVEPPEPPAMTVTSIVAGSGGLIATVNDRGRRVGDPIDKGWTVAEIDLQTRSVVVRHSSGMTARAFLSEVGQPEGDE